MLFTLTLPKYSKRELLKILSIWKIKTLKYAINGIYKKIPWSIIILVLINPDDDVYFHFVHK